VGLAKGQIKAESSGFLPYDPDSFGSESDYPCQCCLSVPDGNFHGKPLQLKLYL
jgi:hypothetical protein